uniref:Uncharacterized protein n=1 Tax=Hanusia phi TaxID=3032 RepID=A0A7S0I1M0_9CRYP
MTLRRAMQGGSLTVAKLAACAGVPILLVILLLLDRTPSPNLLLARHYPSTRSPLMARRAVGGARTQSLLLPWYESVSVGDGAGPESTSYWKVPATSLSGGFPAPPNTFQDPTVWNADSVLNGGNKEWSEEDAALHAYNMQRWRNRILDEQIEKQENMWDLMNRAEYCDRYCGGNNDWGHMCYRCRGWNQYDKSDSPTASLKHADKTAEEAKPNSKKSSNKKGSRNKEELAKNLRKLADDAIKALADLDAPRTEAGKELEQATASKMQKIIQSIKKES